MKQLKKTIKKFLLENNIVFENLEKVKDFIGNSEMIKKKAEEVAKKANNSPNTLTYNLTKDNTEGFKITSYLLEILIYAIANGKEFTLPTIEEKIQVNPDNIAQSIKKIMHPSYDYNVFANFLSNNSFKITGQELERLDNSSLKAMDRFYFLDISGVIKKYLQSDYERKNANFLNFLQTAFRFTIMDARKEYSQKRTTSLDDPYGDNLTKGNMLSGEEEQDSFNDFNVAQKDKSDDDKYSPTVSEKLLVILKLNHDLNELLLNSPNKSLYEFFKLRITGEGGSQKKLGETFSYKDIKNAYKNNQLPESLKNNIEKKLLGFGKRFLISGYNIGKKGETSFVSPNLQLYKKFKQEHPESFNEKGDLIASPALMDFLDSHVKEDKLRPKTLFKRIRREVQDFFKSKVKQVRELVENSGLVNPETNEPFVGMDYINTLLKSQTGYSIPTPDKIGVVSEETIMEDEEENKFSFNDMLKIANQTSKYEERQLQEIKKIVKKNILKSFSK